MYIRLDLRLKFQSLLNSGGDDIGYCHAVPWLYLIRFSEINPEDMTIEFFLHRPGADTGQ